ncbi:MAG: type II toxin-antitoxin system RelE/ParE family toxin [Acidobacteriaceae bacterium]
MIVSFRHKGLEKFFLADRKTGIQPAHAQKLRERLTVLHVIKRISDIPASLAAAWDVHPLKGGLKDHYGLSVSGNWRITFKFTGEDVEMVDYIDYH